MGKIDKVATILKELNNFDNSIFSGRLIFQKSFFIMKELGLRNLKFSFNLYKYGPYCSELASIGYKIEEKGIDSFSAELSYKEKKIIEKFKKMIKNNEDNSLFFEIMADTIYFYRYYQIKSKNKIFNKLKKRGEYLGNRPLFNKCWKILNNEKLVK